MASCYTNEQGTFNQETLVISSYKNFQLNRVHSYYGYSCYSCYSAAALPTATKRLRCV